MTLAHSPVSLVFLPTLFLLLSVSGWGASEPIDGEKGDVSMSWLQNEPQIAAKFRLFTHHCVTSHCTSEGSLLAKVSSSNSWGFYVLFSLPSSSCLLLCTKTSFPSLSISIDADLVSRKWKIRPKTDHVLPIFPLQLTPTHSNYLIAFFVQYSGQNNWNSIWQTHGVIILPTRQREGEKKAKEGKITKKNRTTSSRGSCVHSPAPPAARFLLLPFLWTRGWRAAWFPLHSELNNKRKRGRLEVCVREREGQKKYNLQVFFITIIFTKNTFLITVICCCGKNKMASVYFFSSSISSIHSAIRRNIHAIRRPLETRNRFEEIALNLFFVSLFFSSGIEMTIYIVIFKQK